MWAWQPSRYSSQLIMYTFKRETTTTVYLAHNMQIRKCRFRNQHLRKCIFPRSPNPKRPFFMILWRDHTPTVYPGEEYRSHRWMAFWGGESISVPKHTYQVALRSKSAKSRNRIFWVTVASGESHSTLVPKRTV